MASPLPRWLPAALAASLIMLGLTIFFLWRLEANASTLPDYGPIPGFLLTDQSGMAFGHEDLSGKAALVGFIYTHCPDVCPMLTARMKQLQDRLRDEGLLQSKAVLLSISVDPERDTPEVLAQYALQFGADTASWHFLTGELDTVRQTVVEGFQVGMTRSGAGRHASHAAAGQEYNVSHSGRLVLVDPQGRIRAYYDGESLDLDRVVADVRSLQ